MYLTVQKIRYVFDKSKVLLYFIATGICIQRQYYRINCNAQLQLRLVVTYFKKTKGILANLAVCLFIAFISESKKQWRKSDSLEVDSNDESRFPKINRDVLPDAKGRRVILLFSGVPLAGPFLLYTWLTCERSTLVMLFPDFTSSIGITFGRIQLGYGRKLIGALSMIKAIGRFLWN